MSNRFIELPDGSQRVEIVRVGDLKWDEYQRGRRSSADQVKEHFDSNLLDIPTVSLRESGEMFLVDGKQRATGLAELHGPDFLLFVRVLSGLDVISEVKLFERLNKGHVTVSAYDIFRAQLVAGEEKAVALNKTVTSVDNLVIRPRHGRDAVGSVSELVKMANWNDTDGLAVLREALLTIRIAYPNQDVALNGAILLGVTRFLREMHRQGIYDQAWQGPEDLARRFRAFRETSTAEITFSSAQSAAHRGGATLGSGRAALPVFIRAWNFNRRDGHRMTLPEE